MPEGIHGDTNEILKERVNEIGIPCKAAGNRLLKFKGNPRKAFVSVVAEAGHQSNAVAGFNPQNGVFSACTQLGTV